MAVRAYLRSPAALVWTVLGTLAVGAVVGAGWLCVLAIQASAVGANSPATGGLTELLYLVVIVAAAAVVSVSWAPVSAGIAYAVGREIRGDRTSFRRSIAAVRTSGRPLLRWLKTRMAVGPIAERVLTDDDVAPTEVAVGCEKFVVPALVLDAPGSLPRAVERANRVLPESGYESLVGAGLVATGLFAAAAFFGASADPLPALSPVADVAAPLTAAAVVLGLVLTAAVSVAWRTAVYAAADLSDGFSG